ncbi:peroxiredoxin [Halapricum salinum]|uniref:thioredoxin-dependent peroxiredoxin n=1 Tax=Halapricum salinum TaxID=1457250 RepID=A0A4D6HIM0_9EURY|nr:peroxiredoxin [Halapricum salinum]QCC52872.1 peroxiredoxin [Halapricum salinum]
MPLTPGDDAPTFAAQNQHDKRVVCQYDRPTVVYFYPRDDTPGCTIEAEGFDDSLSAYREAGVTVYGVSTDDVESHREFADEYDIAFDLLADPDGNIADSFDVPVENGAAARTTFVVVDGQVVATYEGVHPEGHAADVLEDLVETGIVSP